MPNEAIEETKLEAICKSCRQSFALVNSSLNHRFICRNCGFSSFLTEEMILRKIPVFSKQEVIEEKKATPKCLFRYFRHGADAPQVGILLELTTSQVKFTTMIKLIISSKIYFHIKDKKFIVNIRKLDELISTSKNGSSVVQYEVTAVYETILAGEVKEKVKSPHYLIK